MTPSDVADIRLIHPHTVLITEPFLDEGGDNGHLYAPYADMLPKIFSKVIKTYQCTMVKVGDIIMLKPHHALDYYLSDHRRIWAMDERAIQCVLPIEGWV